MEGQYREFDKRNKEVSNSENPEILFSLSEAVTDIAFDFTKKSLYLVEKHHLSIIKTLFFHFC